MNEVTVGIALLLFLVGFQWYWGRRRMARLKRFWEEANKAYNEGNMDTAAQALKKCVSLAPLWIMARSMLGAVHARRGDLDGAEEQLKMAAELEPRQAMGHVDLALFYVACMPEQEDKAVAAFNRAVECNPELKEELARDERLRALRDHPAFQSLLK